MQTVKRFFKCSLWVLGSFVLFQLIDAIGGDLIPKGLAIVIGLPEEGIFSTIFMVIAVSILAWLVGKLIVFAIRKANPDFKVLVPVTFKDAKWTIIGYALFTALCYVFSMITASVPSSANQQALEQTLNTGMFNAMFMVVSAVFVAPILEELIFRGLIFNYLSPVLHWGVTCLISGFTFAYIHVVIDFNFITFTPYFIIGCVLGLIYYKTGKIQYPIAAHMLSNAIGVAILLLQ